ncbi:MAG: hypothetical protein Q4P83_04800 [Spirochaetales bacterium]|jgi:hypothetical protein|uniref:Uncharacterized protein n=1 Tax=Treponema berlinense TaxID=225004 RepID=A0A1T4KDV4_9SPIR|nr:MULTISPECIES: hypothetical protein [Treponema]MDO5766912.1 hypothetical protein [Spirochaetales bacterium]MBQ9103256.1 hypothetical protein [Treponema sp.]MCI5541539.1 hypothetical protein [Treponema berlinense]MDD5834115.1 hypothetical protein [Treponema berlinense]MDY3707772.1 hypothetical protein [Treponema berlinense]
MSAEKKFSLNLPLKVILTEEGASHFISHKIKLLRFRLADNIEEYGISLNPFSPQSLQNMILVNYISKIEISMSEFVSVRQEVMDLSKVVVYSLLYKQFDRQLFADFIQTDAVQKHNRKNPTQLIDERTKMSENQLRQILASQKATVQLAKKEILDPVWKSLMENKDYSLEEKNIYLLMTEKFLNRLSLMNWYIITKFYRTEGFSQINIAIRHLLQVYMEKSRVAEYISILVMELALNSENTNMRKEAKRMFAGIEDVDALIYDPEQREKIVAELKRNHEQVFISWKLGGGSSAIGKQGRLQITLYNKDDEFQEVKENIESKASADTNKKSLIDFYRELPEGQESTDLGLYYLSYLDDACKKVNVKFESIVNQFSSSDLTVINLIFNF